MKYSTINTWGWNIQKYVCYILGPKSPAWYVGVSEHGVCPPAWTWLFWWSKLPFRQTNLESTVAPSVVSLYSSSSGNKPYREVVEELFAAQSGLRINVVHFNVAAAASTCPWFAATWLFSEALRLGHLAVNGWCLVAQYCENRCREPTWNQTTERCRKV